MTKPKIFVDGEHGTTGLQIVERLADRNDLQLITIPFEERHSIEARTSLLRDADIAILCLPDDAARQSVDLAQGAGTRFIDASTAHRTAKDWVFGFPELTQGQGERIARADQVSNPGCYSTGAIAILRPLIEHGILPVDYPVTINAVSGYSGGGKQMIAQMEDPSRDDAIKAPHFAYALTLEHKHVPEIIHHSGLKRRPIFTPNVGRFAQGMLVHVPLHLDLLNSPQSPSSLHEVLEGHYRGADRVRVVPRTESEGLMRLDAQALAGTDGLDLHVFGSQSGAAVNIVAALDNLGKGASGAAVQNLDLMLKGSA